MNKRIENGPLGKLLRTLGFLAVLVGALYIATKLVLEHADISFIANAVEFAEMVDEQLVHVSFLNDTAYVFLALVVGFLLLLWVIRKGIILRVLLTALLVVGFILDAAAGQSFLAPIEVIRPEWLVEVLAALEDQINELRSLSDFLVPGISLATAFFLWVLFSYKRPRRISTFILSGAATLLFLAILMNYVGSTFFSDLLEPGTTGDTVMITLYLAAYLLIIAGSAFGIVGFIRK
ncbi:MAG: hypothetical protein ACLFTZ_05605 [Acholeplasmataceae bacterium]